LLRESVAMACAAMTATTAVAALAPCGVAAKAPGGKGVLLMSRKQVALAVSNGSRVSMSATKEHNIAGLTGLALVAASVVPEIAEAAQPGVSDSLRNLLLSVVAGGVVVTVLGVAVAGVSTFDPVSRR